MRGLGLLYTAVTLAVFTSLGLAQQRTVAITVDDLPYSLPPANVAEEMSAVERTNLALLAAFHARHVPVTGFVIQKRIESLGPTSGARILREWISRGFDLGNHTYSHPDINQLSVDQIEGEIVRGESAVRPLMKAAGKELAFFRFPMNETGDTRVKHDEISAFLMKRGYCVATCTSDTSDYLFNDAYVRFLANDDDKTAQEIRLAYLAYTSTEIDYYANLNRQVFGYEPPQVMVLHDNRLNADVIEQLLHVFEEMHYKFVSLTEAQADAAYRTPDTYITKFGPMWGYRWANERKVKANGSLEPDPPKWILNQRSR